MFRRRRVPESVRGVALAPGERRATWGLTASGDPVVATDLGLHLPGSSARLAWADVEKAGWDRPFLTVSEVAVVKAAGRRWRVELADEGELPAVVRTQVSASVAWQDHVALAPSGGVRVVGRRRPGSELLDWQLVFDEDTDPNDPSVQAQAQAVLLDVRQRIG